MKKPISISKNQLSAKLTNLETAKGILKREFVGIDEVIDQLTESVRTWYVLPEIQERPLVVNLWGMTGTGKTSLIRRFTELLELNNSFYPVDMGNSSDMGMFYNTLDEICEHNNQRNFVLLLDEFQHARTIDGKGEEKLTGRMGNIWKMLDTGKLDVHEFKSALWTVIDRLRMLKICLRRGVEVENGYISKNLQLFCKLTGEEFDDDNSILVKDKRSGIPRRRKNKQSKPSKSLPFIPGYEWDEILELQKHRFETELEIEEFLATLNGEQTIKYFTEVVEEAKKPKVLDCSKALIIVAGNLDEAYQMSGNKSPDIPADVWKKLTQDISLNHIKEALSFRFRSEHIARLGNNHIIYPAMGQREFRDYIGMRVENICADFSSRYDIKLTISSGLKKTIYSEGVFPTQGFRPVNTTIDRFLTSQLSNIIGSALINYPKTEQVSLSFKSSKLIARFTNGNTILGTTSTLLRTELSDNRKPKHDNDQALVSVHEAGHVLCSALLLGELPEVAVSATSENGATGFVVRIGKEPPVQKDRLLKLVAYNLGGYVAEKMIFGDENLTMGSSSDLHKASMLVRRVLSDCGFEKAATFETLNERLCVGVIDHHGEVDKFALQYLQEAELLAKEILSKERPLLVHLAAMLFKKGVIKQNDIKSIVLEHANSSFKAAQQEFPFKEMLLEQFQGVNSLHRVA